MFNYSNNNNNNSNNCYYNYLLSLLFIIISSVIIIFKYNFTVSDSRFCLLPVIVNMFLSVSPSGFQHAEN